MQSNNNDEPSDYQQIRQVLLDLVERLTLDGGLNNTEIAKLHFDAATDRLSAREHRKTLEAQIRAHRSYIRQAEKNAEVHGVENLADKSVTLEAIVYHANREIAELQSQLPKKERTE